MIKTILALTAISTLAGCSTFSAPAYECQLEDTPQAKCASMEQTYAALKRVDPKAKTTSIFDPRALKDQREDNRPVFQGRESDFPEPGQQGMPVFAQPKVHRVWVAPYVDADGNLRTGEYTYFSTPGKWNYGSTKASGAASGIFGPAKPGALGFTPVDKKATVVAPANKPAAPPNTTTTTVQKPAVDSITQPYQKLTD